MPRRASIELSISQLEKVLHQRRAKLGTLEKQRMALSRRLKKVEGKILVLGGDGIGRPGRRRRRVRNARSLNETIVAVLKKASGAVRVADIVKGVLSTGYRSTSANFRGIVNQALIKDKRFAKAGARGTYQLK
ncbi:MAG: hypothetical protein ABR964_09545 [Tepidisphaeraceae bacterium]|jgi:hypothetical protein